MKSNKLYSETCSTLDLHYAIIDLENIFLSLLLSDRLRHCFTVFLKGNFDYDLKQ